MSRNGLYRTVEHFTHPLPYSSLAQREPFSLVWDTPDYTSTADPKAWGPCMWFFLHTSAAYYPVSPNTNTQQAMKNFIMSLPYILPCQDCQKHAMIWVNQHLNQLGQIISSRDNLFKFFVDFHNYVNTRSGKPEISYAEAYQKYRNGVKVERLKY